MGRHAMLLDVADQVATAWHDLGAGWIVEVSLGDVHYAVTLREPVRFGHKFAVRAIAAGEAVLQYGRPIGRATREIAAGEWVGPTNLEG